MLDEQGTPTSAIDERLQRLALDKKESQDRIAKLRITLESKKEELRIAKERRAEAEAVQEEIVRDQEETRTKLRKQRELLSRQDEIMENTAAKKKKYVDTLKVFQSIRDANNKLKQDLKLKQASIINSIKLQQELDSDNADDDDNSQDLDDSNSNISTLENDPTSVENSTSDASSSASTSRAINGRELECVVTLKRLSPAVIQRYQAGARSEPRNNLQLDPQQDTQPIPSNSPRIDEMNPRERAQQNIMDNLNFHRKEEPNYFPPNFECLHPDCKGLSLDNEYEWKLHMSIHFDVRLDAKDVLPSRGKTNSFHYICPVNNCSKIGSDVRKHLESADHRERIAAGEFTEYPWNYALRDLL